MPSRLALFAPSLTGGGIADVFTNLARGFCEAGYAVDLLLARKRGPFLKQVPPAARVVDFQASHVSFSLPALVRYLRKWEPDVLFSAPCGPSLTAVVARLLTGGATRLVVTEHSIFAQTVRRAQSLKARTLVALARRAYPFADAFVAVSEDAAQSLAACTRLSREQIAVIPNPVVVPDATAGGEPTLPWPLDGSHDDSDAPLILGAGRLTEQKDIPTLLRAFARLREGRAARLVVLGEGPRRSALEALAQRLSIREDVHLPGFVDDPYAYMRAASVFALSSHDEPFGLVLVEAMACGTPVVSTDCPGGPSDILKGGALGPLVPVGDDEALAAALGDVLDAPPPADMLTRRAADFSRERAVEAYLALVESLHS